MSEKPDHLIRALRERGVQYVVGPEGLPVAVVLSLEEFEHYLNLLDDEADSDDPELAARLSQAAQPASGQRQALRDYLCQRAASR